jgi:hypothetical protein
MWTDMRSNVVEFQTRARSPESSDAQIAACEEELLRAHNEAIEYIRMALRRHVDIHHRVLNLMTESARKRKALADLHLIELAANLISVCR